MNDLLIVTNVSKNFNGIKALDRFSFAINRSEILGLIGPNGAGKSTVFNAITGLNTIDKGLINFKGRNILGKSLDRIALLGISRTFQNLRLIRQMTVIENILLSFRNQKGENFKNIFLKWQKSKREESKNKERALYLLESAGITNKAYDLASDLSYGQQKLLSIICCIASDTELLLLDEPIAGINPALINQILSMLLDLQNKGKSIVIIEHNVNVIMEVCDRVIFMDKGATIVEGDPEYVCHDKRVIDAYIS